MLEIMSTLLCELLVAVLRAVLKLRGGEPLPRSQKAKKHPVGIGLKELSLNPPDRRLHNLEILSQ